MMTTNYYIYFGKIFLDNYSKIHVTGWEKSDKVYIESILGPYFGEYQLRDINVLLVDKYKRMRLEKGIQESSINRELSMLRKVFNKAIAWQLMESSPIDKVDFGWPSFAGLCRCARHIAKGWTLAGMDDVDRSHQHGCLPVVLFCRDL